MGSKNWQRWLHNHHVNESHIYQDEAGIYWIKDNNKKQIDWFTKHHLYHRKGIPKKQHKLAQAIYGRMTIKPFVFDACAGLGYDAFLLSLSGCEVVACEKNPSIFALLADMHTRSKSKIWFGKDKIKIIFGCAEQVMRQWPRCCLRPDVVYLDPMFDKDFKGEVRANAALLKSIVAVENTEQLFTIAISTARFKVVVKRPIYAKPLTNQKPTYSVRGKTTRYDVYQVG